MTSKFLLAKHIQNSGLNAFNGPESHKTEDIQPTHITFMRKQHVLTTIPPTNKMNAPTYTHLQAFNGRRAFNGAFPFDEIPPCRGEGA